MATTVHQLVLFPGGSFQNLCKDGLSPIDELNIQKLYNFGGKIKFINCGPKIITETLNKGEADMYDEYITKLYRRENYQILSDFNRAYKLNEENFNKWKNK